MTRGSIVRPIVLLVVAAVLVANLIQFTITFEGPPPLPEPVPLARIAEALRTGRPPSAGRELRLERSATPPSPPPRSQGDPATDAAIATLLGVPASTVQGRYMFPSDRRDMLRGSFHISMRTASGYVTVETPPPPFLSHWHAVTLLSILAMLVVLAVAAWWVARAISRPIGRLAEAARDARLGSRTPIPQKGPREVRALAEAFDAMQSRILEQAEGRTAMLAAIAHDLGTPLSRIAYWIEQLPETARDRAAADIAEMRAMLGEVLRFGREARAAPTERIDLGSLIESLAEDLRAGGLAVEAEPGPRTIVLGESQALRRLFVNLAENAVRYGRRARLGWSVAGRWAEVVVADDGPGFGAEPEQLFAPFVRGESSRNRATGGTGLGLAIVRAIAEAHGGEVLLENGDVGGGRVRVRLRRAD